MAKKMAKRPISKKGKTKPKLTKAQKAQALAAATKKEVPVVYAPIPNVIMLTKQTAQLVWKHKAVLGGIALTYGLLSLLLVRGLGSGVNFSDLREQIGGISAYAQLLSNPSGATTPAAGAYQLFLFIIISLATVWALRQLTADTRVTVRDAFYRGMHPLVPFTLVMLVVGLQLIPTLIGVSVYQQAILSGVAASMLEVIIWGLFAFGLSLVSLYFLAASLMALYIVTLPNMTPVLSLRMARRLVSGRRWTVLRRILFMPLVLFIAIGVIMAPVVWVTPFMASWVLFVLGALALVLAHSYLYNLYQGLLNEQQTTD